MINLRAIDHVVFRAKNVEAMVAFYENVLDAQVEKRQPEIGLIQLRAGQSLIDFVDVNSDIGRMGGAPAGPEGHNVDHVCFRVLPWDGEAILAHLAAHGIADAEITSRYGAEGDGPSIYLTDPEGNGIELKGPPWPPNRAKTG